MALIAIERRGAVALLTLNRPRARNAINGAMAESLCSALAESQDARCIVITGADPAFCAGLDLKEFEQRDRRAFPTFTFALRASKTPLIAAVNGAAVTGGLEIALSCDFIVASERACFADTHLKVGVYPGPALVDLPRRVGEAWAREMSLTGEFIDAATALRIGLVNHVRPHEALLPFALDLAAAIAAQDRRAVTLMRREWEVTAGLPLTVARAAHETCIEAGNFRHSHKD